MSEHETNAENKAKILLDEANLTFCETTERKDTPNNRTLDGSPWDQGKMDGEFDEEDYNKILELQLQAAVICDEHPELEEKTGEMFQTVTAENADEVLKQIMEEPDLRDLAKIAVIIFLLRFPSVQSLSTRGIHWYWRWMSTCWKRQRAKLAGLCKYRRRIRLVR